MKMEKLIRDGNVAVLYSPGYGAGWYTWNPKFPEIVFDPVLVELVERGDFKLVEWVARGKYPGIYTGGVEDLVIEWLPEGTIFEIKEYDGSESLHVIGDREYLVA